MPETDQVSHAATQAPDDAAIILGQFQTYLDTITALEGRRAQVSGIYASILGAMIAATGLDNFDLRALAAAGFFISGVWLVNLAFFRTMAEVKWTTALEIEARLPMTPFAREYALIKARRARPRALKLGFIARERILPWIVLIVSGAYLGQEAVSHLRQMPWPQ